ncbi:peptide chain release factor N(5)-glutamine methyltransferase [Eupransor demetentiae]|uniref:Release factor glutamine methyltransferase n=1 Tax=Eupransor demetentiae TaxID=3109584 RepID=A0ABP0ET30_9LACO|nr:Methylase of polypeptide chain release factors (HemK) [Lactobacillaceae bacterium LMG 33000]
MSAAVPKISFLEARKWAQQELRAAGKWDDDMADNLDFLLSGAMGWNYGMLRANITRMLPENLAQVWPSWVAALLTGRPPQYILGSAPFYGREFQVDERVLIPRPETEQLVEWILADLKERAAGPIDVLDIGTGSGAIMLTLALENKAVQGVASDISLDALALAGQNLRAFNLGERVELRPSDVWENLTGETFNIIVSNPPYIAPDDPEVDDSVNAYEPHQALYADEQGLAIYREIAAGLADHLKAGGAAYFEIGYTQGPALLELFQQAVPDAEVSLKQDFAGLDRMIRVKLHADKEVR